MLTIYMLQHFSPDTIENSTFSKSKGHDTKSVNSTKRWVILPPRKWGNFQIFLNFIF